MKRFLTLIISIVASLPVSAYVVNATPGDFAAGANVTEAFEGASLHVAHSGLNSNYMDSIYATDCDGCDEPTNGVRVFSPIAEQTYWNPTFSYEEEFRKKIVQGNSNSGSDVFLAQFDKATNFVQVKGQSSNVNSWYLDVWSTDGELITSCSNIGLYEGSDGCTHTRSGYGSYETAWISDTWTVSFQSEATNIGFVSVAGWVGPAYVHSLSYGVPEPAPGLLVGAGLLGLLVRRHIKK